MSPAGLWDSRVDAIIQESLQAMHDNLWSQRQREIEEIEALYRGGSDVSQFLIKHDGEESSEWLERLTRACYANYVARLADALRDGAYGGPVTRSLGPTAKEGQDDLFAKILAWNSMPRIQRELGYSIVVPGDGWTNVAWREADEAVALFVVHPSNIWYVPDADNPRKIAKLVERREDLSSSKKGEKRYVYWIWTWDTMAFVDKDGRSLELISSKGKSLPNPAPNPYGEIPYIHYRGRPVVGSTDGMSYVRDAAPIQKNLYNVMSELDDTVLHQAFSTLHVSDYQKPEISMGPRRYIQTGANGKAEFLSPGPPIAEVEAMINRRIEIMCEISGVPISTFKGGMASSGYQLALEMQPLLRTIETIRSEALESEREQVRMICRVWNAHGSPALPDPDTLEPQVSFDADVLPSDKEAEFNRDLLQLNNIPPLMTREDFLRKWREDLRDDTAVEEYIAKLDEEKAKKEPPKPAGGSNPFSSLFAPPPEEEQP